MNPVLVALLAAFVVVAAGAQEVCPCVPVPHVWSVETCETWNCAAAAMIAASGDRYVLSMPAPSNDARWLIIKRVKAGSYTVSPDAPFVAETFDGVDGASSRYVSLVSDRTPMLLSVPDGKFVVVMSREPEMKRRAVGR